MRLLLFLATWLAFSSSAWAFHEIESFARTEAGGGDNVYFTGSPRFKGYDCRICHTETDDKISIGFGVNRGEFAEGLYEGNTGYAITLKLLGEHRGLNSAFNPNTFMLEFVNDAGDNVGSYLTGPAPTTLTDERRIVVAEGFGEGEDEWNFTWFSPRDDLGPITMYLAMVDGDGAGEEELRWIDPLNDDVATMKLRLCPVGDTCPTPPAAEDFESRVGCSVSSRSSSSLSLLLLFAVLLFMRSLRTRS